MKNNFRIIEDIRMEEMERKRGNELNK